VVREEGTSWPPSPRDVRDSQSRDRWGGSAAEGRSPCFEDSGFRRVAVCFLDDLGVVERRCPRFRPDWAELVQAHLWLFPPAELDALVASAIGGVAGPLVSGPTLMDTIDARSEWNEHRNPEVDPFSRTSL